METIKNHITVSDLNFNLLTDTFKKIDAFTEANGFQFKGAKNHYSITEADFKAALTNLSKRKRKKITAYIWAINNKPTFGGINKFFHFFMKFVMKSDLRVKLDKSDRELAIEAKRKVYKDALAVVRAAYADYKETKGNFYKKKLAAKA